MIILICFGVMLICGLLMVINPKLGVKPEKLKNGITYEEAVKKNKISGIIFIIIAIILLLINLM
ncbi:MAG: hypothetical protein MR598_04235 [Erysipelotrichaceae bacterium]|nr:hypothetical protein [Erysipelotrichaceae bacterium]